MERRARVKVCLEYWIEKEGEGVSVHVIGLRYPNPAMISPYTNVRSSHDESAAYLHR